MSLKEDREGTQSRTEATQLPEWGWRQSGSKKKTATKRNDVRIGGGYASRDETSHY